MHFTLKTSPLQRSDLDDFVKCYKAGARARRQDTWSEDLKELSPGQTEYKGRWRGFDYDELVARGVAAVWGSVAAEQRERDLRDSTRSDSPLRPAEGAVIVDSSHLSLAQVVDAVVALVPGVRAPNPLTP